MDRHSIDLMPCYNFHKEDLAQASLCDRDPRSICYSSYKLNTPHSEASKADCIGLPSIHTTVSNDTDVDNHVQTWQRLWQHSVVLWQIVRNAFEQVSLFHCSYNEDGHYDGNTIPGNRTACIL